MSPYRSSEAFNTFILEELLDPAAREAVARKRQAGMDRSAELRAQEELELVQQEQAKVAQASAAKSRFWTTLFGSGGGMLAFGILIFLAGVGLMRSTKESGLAAVGFVCLLVGVVLFVAGLSEFWDLIG